MFTNEHPERGAGTPIYTKPRPVLIGTGFD